MVARWTTVFLISVIVLTGCGEKKAAPLASAMTSSIPEVAALAAMGSVPSVASPDAGNLVIPDDQLRVIAESREALTYLATKSPEAKVALAFYDTSAIIGKWEAIGIRVVNVPTEGQKAYFFLAADPRPVTFKEGESGAVFARFYCRDKGPPSMMLHGGHASQLARGLMLAHELEHARDCLLNGEPDSKVLSESWLMGELNAHAKVMLVLNEWTQGGWKKIVSASRERREAMTASRGHRPESSVFGQLPEDREAFAKQFGVLDDVTIGLLFFQLDVDANLLNINVQMQRYGRPEAEAMGHYLEVLHALYAQNLGIIQRND